MKSVLVVKMGNVRILWRSVTVVSFDSRLLFRVVFVYSYLAKDESAFFWAQALNWC